MRPHKVHGFTDAERQRMCEGKQRYADLPDAEAGALFSLERNPRENGVYAYRCQLCAGWHLTRSGWQHPDQPKKIHITHPEIKAIRLIERLVDIVWKQQEAA